MTEITQLASKTTWASLGLAVIFQLLIFFKPSPLELGLFILIDGIMFLVATKSDPYLFRLFFPGSSSFYPVLQAEQLQEPEVGKKVAIFRNMVKYPLQRSLYLFGMNFIKVAPPTAFVVFYWNHGMHPMLAFTYLLNMMLFVFSYLLGMVYLENHSWLSEQLDEIHRKYDWSAVFMSSEIVPPKEDSQHLLETASIIAIWIFVSTLQITIICDHSQTVAMKVLASMVTGIFACFFSMRITYHSRQAVFRGLHNVFDFFSAEKQDRQRAMSLNTYPLVSGFQKTLNNLIHEIHINEREISTWIIERAEKKRYSELGERAGLVVHDLLNPMHNIQYCVSCIREATVPGLEKYTVQLEQSVQHSLNLLEGLKDNIRNPLNRPTISFVDKAEANTKKILRFYFNPQDVNAVRFSNENIVSCGSLNIPQPELNQIFVNLYSNAIKDLISNKIPSPTVRLSVLRETENDVTLAIQDNGTGLSWKNFEFITREKENIAGGIGLRLTKRLVEHYAGQLNLIPRPEQGGTTFHLKLKKSSAPAESLH